MFLLPYQDILIWSLVLSFLISLIYRLFTKPEEMRQLKKDMKFYREKSKEAQQQKDMKKTNEYMSEMLKLNQKQMRHTMKPMFVTLGLVLVILSFVNQTYSSVAVQTTPLDDKTSVGHFAYDGFNHSLMAEKLNETDIRVVIDVNENAVFSDDATYSRGDIAKIGNINWAVDPKNMNLTTMDIVVRTPFRIPIFGWNQLSWLFWYILISLPATWIFRKALGVE